MTNKILCYIAAGCISVTFQLLTLTADAEASSVKYSDLATTQWLHGVKSCKNDQNPLLQVIQADASSYVIRQNKCTTFEAPFIYVLFGRKKALVVDTGAIELPSKSPVYKTIESLLLEQQFKLSNDGANGGGKLIVIHSHSHTDHTEGDFQFKGKEGVEVVGTGHQSVETYLGLKDWPNMTSSFDLGGRVVTFIPIPGHQEQSIAVYDDQTGWLLTGDTLYPGSIRVKNWEAFKSSIERLVLFSQSNAVSLILGSHIEMNTETKSPYRIGTIFQPMEPPLALLPSHMKTLNDKLRTTKKAKKLKFDSFTISPLSAFEKLMSKLMTNKKHSE